MKEQSGRLILVLAAAALASPLFLEGHGKPRKDYPVAFLPFTSPGITIMLQGDSKNKGAYRILNEADVASVIKMTAPAVSAETIERVVLDTKLHNGDIVTISCNKQQFPEISVNSRSARDKMLLGIPLHPDHMDFDDWRSLPGIGPVLAGRLVSDRQLYGDYFTAEAVQRVPGMGEKKYSAIEKYFR